MPIRRTRKGSALNTHSPAATTSSENPLARRQVRGDDLLFHEPHDEPHEKRARNPIARKRAIHRCEGVALATEQSAGTSSFMLPHSRPQVTPGKRANRKSRYWSQGAEIVCRSPRGDVRRLARRISLSFTLLFAQFSRMPYGNATSKKMPNSCHRDKSCSAPHQMRNPPPNKSTTQ